MPGDQPICCGRLDPRMPGGNDSAQHYKRHHGNAYTEESELFVFDRDL